MITRSIRAIVLQTTHSGNELLDPARPAALLPLSAVPGAQGWAE